MWNAMEEIELNNGEARVETDALSVQEQVKRAYADAHGIDNGYKPERRCLSFLTDRWVTPEKASELVKFIGQYNYFNPDRVADKLSMLEEEAEVNFKVAIGREGSPVIYFATDAPEAIRADFEDYADEFGEVEAPDIAGKEQYRDDDYPVDEHASCKHNSPPVEPEREARGSEGSGLTYIRAWWD